MKKDEILNKFTKAIDAVESKDETEAAMCAIALSMPIFMALLADIRDALIKLSKETQ